MWAWLASKGLGLLKKPVVLLIIGILAVTIWGTHQKKAKERAQAEALVCQGTIVSLQTVATITAIQREAERAHRQELQKIDQDPDGWLDDYFNAPTADRVRPVSPVPKAATDHTPTKLPPTGPQPQGP